MSDSDIDRDIFGPLVDIEEAALVRLASRIAKQVLGLPELSGKVVARIGGSHNIVHIVQLEHTVKLVIRVPATGWGPGLASTAAAQSLRSYGATTDLIREKTTIPVPRIFDIDVSPDNEIHAPFICLSFVEGKTVFDTWFDDATTEHLRLKILQSVALNMAQLSCFSFDKIGSIVDSKNLEIGPCFDYDCDDDGAVSLTSSGPFISAAAYLQEHFHSTENTNVWGKSKTRIMNIIQDCLSHVPTKPGFSLTLPDFDSQNVMVDDTGTVSGFIDLDLAQTMPRYMGYIRYPSWITRDWDPIMYGWPKMTDSEDSPEALVRYREYYNQELVKALKGSSNSDWCLSRKSQIYEAMWIACLNPTHRLEICRKFVSEALQITADDALSILYEIGSDDYEDEDEWAVLEAKLRQLCS